MEAAKRFGRIEPVAAAPSAQIELGRALYWDTRLSADGKTACASCHSAYDWGADRRSASIDARGNPTRRNSPTVFNALRQPMLRWLGDRGSGAEQAEGSITGSMGFRAKDEILPLLRQSDYEAAFRAAFPGEAEPVSTRNYGRAIAAYEATLVTPAPFDRYLGGDAAVLTARQKAGLRLFIERGCAGCHAGALLGGSAWMRFGVVKDYWLATGSARIDEGRYAITRKEEDRYVFRVPMLRNIAKTAPYFHDGSVPTLEAAVRVMASVQLGQTLGDDEAAAIVAFLESLAGDVPANYAPPAQRP
ncbi:MAG: cytochrome-c peroxidase [Betaproteobacteria bacterium]|nr:MAG: cytochrome-c peroxidase [Betaproteobacteria bacterium]